MEVQDANAIGASRVRLYDSGSFDHAFWYMKNKDEELPEVKVDPLKEKRQRI